MRKSIYCSKLIYLLLFITALIVFIPVPVSAGQIYATYTAPDGFKVVSYTAAWADTSKLKSVYEELLRNTHGEELKLLRKINIYPGPDWQGMSAAGRWYGLWEIKNGIPVLAGDRYIDIYNCSNLTGVKDIARTLAHEYGHHFTYYWYFKQERRSWEEWRNTTFAAARELKSNSRVSTGSVEHRWLIQEIAAEDYVQLFGSPTVKQSLDFKDIYERLESNETRMSFDTDIYNYHPQENHELPLASNLPKLEQYWLKASGLSDKNGGAPSQVTLKLEEVRRLENIQTPQYRFSWNKGSDDNSNLEYTLVWFKKSSGNSLEFYPVKTVSGSEPLSALFGSATDSSKYIWEKVPDGVAYFVVYVKDTAGNITSSRVLAVDFTDPLDPDTVLIDDNSLSNGFWFPPRVTVDKKQLNFDVPPVIVNGRTIVPLRAIFEELNAMVSWEPKTRTIEAVKNNVKITLQVGNRIAFINDQRVILDVPPEITRGRTLVPLRFVSESLGSAVDWNPRLQLVKITQ